MKYLKKFNESIEEGEEDIKQFAETLFVNLEDNDFVVETKYNKSDSTYVEVYIYKQSSFLYSEIENEVKTFVDYMKRKWEHIDLIYKYEGSYSESRAKSKEPLSNTKIVGSTTGRPPSLKLIVKKMDKKPNFFTKISKQFHHTWTDL
jgi:hypothetical protein